jgi:hypothetical protein
VRGTKALGCKEECDLEIFGHLWLRTHVQLRGGETLGDTTAAPSHAYLHAHTNIFKVFVTCYYGGAPLLRRRRRLLRRRSPLHRLPPLHDDDRVGLQQRTDVRADLGLEHDLVLAQADGAGGAWDARP